MAGTKQEWNGCPLRYAAAEFADRWAFVLLRDILLLGRRRFGEMAAADEGIATNILADRLSRLENSGILESHRDPANGRRKIYLPTEKGLDLIPVILAMIEWAHRWDDETQVPDSFVADYRQDPDALAQDIRQRTEALNRELLQAKA